MVQEEQVSLYLQEIQHLCQPQFQVVLDYWLSVNFFVVAVQHRLVEFYRVFISDHRFKFKNRYEKFNGNLFFFFIFKIFTDDCLGGRELSLFLRIQFSNAFYVFLHFGVALLEELADVSAGDL